MKTTAHLENSLADAEFELAETKDLAPPVIRSFRVLNSTLPSPSSRWQLLMQWPGSLFRKKNRVPISLRIRLRIGSAVHIRVRIFGIDVNLVSFTQLHHQTRQEKPLSLVSLNKTQG